MGRAKISMELITKEKTRNTTYLKRKDGIIKKATEFSVLCDVDTIIIIYPPNSDHPEIWPENPDQIKKTIASYKAKKNEAGKREYNLNDFFQDRMKKIEDELLRARKRNMEAKYSTWFDELDCLSEGQLREFTFGLESKETIVRDQLEFIKRNMINMQMPMPFELENNQQFIHQAALYPSVDQVQAAMYPSVDQVQAANQHLMNHDLGWFGYPVFECGMVYDNPNPLAFQQVVQCSLMPPELALQVNHDHVYEYDCVGDFVMDAHQGGFTA